MMEWIKDHEAGFVKREENHEISLTRYEILLVEDNPDDAALTLRALKKHNFADNLLWLKNGREALDYIFAPNANNLQGMKVIFLDLKLPFIDGLEVLQKIKTDEQTKTTPAVMLTSSGESEDIAKAYRLGANSYIVKPVIYDDFMDTISALGAYWLKTNIAPS